MDLPALRERSEETLPALSILYNELSTASRSEGVELVWAPLFIPLEHTRSSASTGIYYFAISVLGKKHETKSSILS